MTLFRSKHKHFNPVAVCLGDARGNKSIIFFNDLCKPIEIYIYARKKHPFTNYPAAQHPKTINLRLQTYDKTQWTFFTGTARAPILTPAIILRIRFLCKSFHSCKIYNSLVILSPYSFLSASLSFSNCPDPLSPPFLPYFSVSHS